MKQLNKTLLEKEFSFKGQYLPSDGSISKSKLRMTVHFNFQNGLFFKVHTPDFMTQGYRNPFKAFMVALEHEHVKGIKYDVLKGSVRKAGITNL